MAKLDLRTGCAMLALVCSMGISAAAAAQQQTAKADDQADAAAPEIVVTGSFIRGTR